MVASLNPPASFGEAVRGVPGVHSIAMSEPGRPDERTARPDSSSERVASHRTLALRLGTGLIGITGLLFIVQGLSSAYQTYVKGGFETGVHELDGMTAAELSSTHPEVADYIAHLHLSFSGLVVASGAAIIALALYGVRRRRRWTLATALMIPVVFGGAMVPVHGTVQFDFQTLVHLGPAGIGTVIVVTGGILSAIGMTEASEASHA